MTTSWLEEAGLPVRSAQGLDVSDFQGHFDWSATSGLSFGTFRLTQGLGGAGTASPDPDAAWNHREIAKAQLHRGAYHFLDPRLPGAQQAAYMVAEHAKLGTTSHDSFWCDNETGAGVSAAAIATCAKAFMRELDKLVPRNPRGVYTFIDFAASGCCAGLGEYALWLAHPGALAPTPPPPWHRWKFWQFGTRNGVDADAFNGTAPQLDEWVKSFAPAVKPPAPKVVTHVTAGDLSLAGLAVQHHTKAMHILHLTSDHFGGFPPEVAAWGNAVWAGILSPSAAMPAGMHLRIPA
jgi:GH25 family lysozyme M1 (1,4-beta-N-acetylmuramidase)